MVGVCEKKRGARSGPKKQNFGGRGSEREEWVQTAREKVRTPHRRFSVPLATVYHRSRKPGRGSETRPENKYLKPVLLVK